ncbi:MAG: AbrB/MazE/SpoVT family DNA-binding domain-containing protein [Spirochaetia bacterium]
MKLVKIGNSRGIRLPQELLQSYDLVEGDEVDIEPRRDGIVLHPVAAGEAKLSYDVAYRQMADEASEAAEWAEWDISAGDGLED